jgi:hypothetical protein
MIKHLLNLSHKKIHQNAKFVAGLRSIVILVQDHVPHVKLSLDEMQKINGYV